METNISSKYTIKTDRVMDNPIQDPARAAFPSAPIDVRLFAKAIIPMRCLSSSLLSLRQFWGEERQPAVNCAGITSARTTVSSFRALRLDS